MRIYLMQHGHSLPENIDPNRGLSEQGKKETRKIGWFLKKRNIKIATAWHSSKLRSKQTAQIISEYLHPAKLVERNDINPNDPVERFPREIEKTGEELLIVGHLPFLQKLCSEILADSSSYDLVSFKNSGVICIENGGDYKILWVVVPEIA